jgi:hypothetical protein
MTERPLALPPEAKECQVWVTIFSVTLAAAIFLNLAAVMMQNSKLFRQS